MSRLVVDASVGVKWVVDEDQSAEAAAVADLDFELIVPDLFAIEVANVLWRKARSSAADSLTRDEAVHCFADLRDLLASERLRVVASAPIQAAALELATLTDRTVYDSLYLALALSEGCKVITADKKFVNGLKGTAYADRLLLLGVHTALT